MGVHDGERSHRARSGVTRFVLRDGLLLAAVACYTTASVLAAVGIARFHHSPSIAYLEVCDALRTGAFLMLVAWGFMRTHVERAWGRAIRALADVTELNPPPHEGASRPGESQWPPRRAG